MNSGKSKIYDLFDDILGQDIAISFLKTALKKNQIAPAYIFSGPDGVGRRLSAIRFLEGILTGGLANKKERRRLANYNHPDFYYLEPSYIHQGKSISISMAKNESHNLRNPPQIRLDQIRQVSRFLCKEPVESPLSMVVIEGAEKMNEPASNALLKTLEEPGKGILILISERPDLLLQTIHSRCQKIPFKRLTKDLMNNILSNSNETDLNILSGITSNEELLRLSNGAPGAYIKHLNILEGIPGHIWPLINTMPTKPIEALSLARTMTEELNIEQQIWIINWIQQSLWMSEIDFEKVKIFEKLRYQILSFVQPRLAWEVSLLAIIKTIKH